ncbi:TonB-dependent receptor [Ketobacter sp. MCCC 1A13808]|uniref:TonB-dependent receptor plug domain-containing protein n=1 Tax=Ketobacter sp. MCCC 1A13808 TaxID=2602738 RepID=UPI0012EBBA06|nr:TonB-dependent receptor [Ketobacter sp. MCCC 1A13808]MVF11350.1 TonB-dependent receptor [Ketobacter sp. MCCC 1A13808]
MAGRARKFLHQVFHLLPLLPLSSGAFADNVDSLLALSLQELGEISVSIATGSPKSITGAPAGASLITANDIYTMGALTLEDALQTVPGLYISRASVSNAPRYFFRGVASRHNPQALLLVNGVPMSGLFLGDRSQHLPNQYSLPAKIIERIEIIRGPGSALYGADAFAGVINVITTGAEDLETTAASIAGGSFDTVRSTLKQPFQAGEANGVLLLSYQASEGDRSNEITHDLQTNIDQFMQSPPVSEAPAPPQNSLKTYDARVDLSWDKLRIRAGTMRAWDIGTGTGISDALDADGRFVHDTSGMDITWTDNELVENLLLEAKISYLHTHFRSSPSVQLFPPGAFFGAFPDGAMSLYSVAEENAQAGITAAFNGVESHRITVGSGYHWGDLYKTTGYNNSQFMNGVFSPRPAFVETADTADIFMPERQRTSYYVFAQDEWLIAPSWELTAGIRYDDYDDIGSTVNPRAALVWQTSESWTSKLLYSEAFRVPSFSELWVTSNPTALGNPNLNPEKLRSTELVLIWQPGQQFTTTLNLYQFYIEDYIDFVSDGASSTAVAQNIGRFEGSGAELEFRYPISEQWTLLSNYSYQQTQDTSTRQDLGLAPTQMGYVQLTWRPADWIVSPQVRVVGERLRQAEDDRPPLEGYISFDLSIRRQWGTRYSLGLIAQNLFDADIREPTQGPGVNAALPSIPYDLPQQGRAVTLELNIEL